MNWHQLRWEIPLSEKPEINFVGIGNHEPGVRRYLNHDLWCLHLYRYEGEISFLGYDLPIRPGYVSIIPPNTFYEYRMSVPAVHAVALFSLPESNENKPYFIAAMQEVSEAEKFDAMYRQMEEAIAFNTLQRRRAEVRLWDILWQLVDTPQTPLSVESNLHPSVFKAIQLIEARIGQPILISQLAREVGLSHDRLTKLFRATFKTTVAGYILERRVSLAHGFLLHSTMPIKSIAAEIGFSDTQVFNKVMRRVIGHSPSAIRKYSIQWTPLPIKRKSIS